jgi:S-adenosylmethionine decarboxylase
MHLIIDIETSQNLIDSSLVVPELEMGAEACGATVLQSFSHSFGERSGYTAFIMLAESHISIHTWPELNYAALDVFMCGACNPHKIFSIVEKLFGTRYEIREIERPV